MQIGGFYFQDISPVIGYSQPPRFLDDFANATIKRRMEQCGYICIMASEEEDSTIPVLDGYEGKYTLAFDPLDGSSNIDVNVSIGTIFSVHRKISDG